MLGSDLPSVRAILLKVALDNFLKQRAPGFLVLKEQLVDFSKLSLLFSFFNASSEFDPGTMEHLEVVLEDSHERFEGSAVHRQRLDMGDLGDQFYCTRCLGHGINVYFYFFYYKLF